MDDEDDFNFVPQEDVFTSTVPLSNGGVYLSDPSHERMLQGLEPTYDDGNGDLGDQGSSAPRNFQALLSLPTSQLPRTVLPSMGSSVGSTGGGGGGGAMSIKAALQTIIGASTKAKYGRYGKNASVTLGLKSKADAAVSETAAASHSGDAAGDTLDLSTLPISNSLLDRYSWKQQRNVSKPWSEEETRRFYDALQQYGADFSLVSVLFPGRRREDVKKKFQSELRSRPQLVEEALHSKSQMPVDLDMLDEGIQQWKEHDSKARVTPMTAEDEQLLQEFVLDSNKSGAGGARPSEEGTPEEDDFMFGDGGGEPGGSSSLEFGGITYDDEDLSLADQLARMQQGPDAHNKAKAPKAKKANPKKESEAGKKRAREKDGEPADGNHYAEGGNEFEFL